MNIISDQCVWTHKRIRVPQQGSLTEEFSHSCFVNFVRLLQVIRSHFYPFQVLWNFPLLEFVVFLSAPVTEPLHLRIKMAWLWI
jgi:hypothetical protein